MKRTQQLLFVLFIGLFFLNVHFNEPIDAIVPQDTVQVVRVQQAESCTFVIAEQQQATPEVIHQPYFAIQPIRISESLQIYHDQLSTSFYIQRLNYLAYRASLKPFIQYYQPFLKNSTLSLSLIWVNYSPPEFLWWPSTTTKMFEYWSYQVDWSVF